MTDGSKASRVAELISANRFYDAAVLGGPAAATIMLDRVVIIGSDGKGWPVQLTERDALWSFREALLYLLDKFPRDLAKSDVDRMALIPNTEFYGKDYDQVWDNDTESYAWVERVGWHKMDFMGVFMKAARIQRGEFE